MQGKYRILLLILTLMVIVTVVTGITIVTLYNAAFAEERERLTETAISRARIIESMARFDKQHSMDNVEGGAFAATMLQIREAHKRFEGFGESGEFTLARREGDRIVFLLSHRHADLGDPAPVPFDSSFAEPMRRALKSESGTLVGLDYRGELVLAAHEPVAVLDLGIVAKIDLREVRAPFVRAGLQAGTVGLVLIVLGTFLFLRIGNPMVSDLQESETRLLKSLKEKELLLREIHHRVKNNLQVISSILNMQRRREQDPGLQEALAGCHNRIAAMALSHERLYRSDDLVSIDIGQYVRSIAENLFRIHGVRPDQVELRLDVDNAALDLTRANPCGMIINELVSNSLKHAFPNGQKGRITVRLQPEGEEILLVVADNGVGFPDGIDFRKTETLGLELVNTFVDQLEGRIEQRTGKGTEYRVRFRISGS